MTSERQTGNLRVGLVKLWCSEIPQQWGMLCSFCLVQNGCQLCKAMERPREAYLVAAQTIEARTAYLKPLAALAGRLDLLIAHLPKQQESSSAVDVSGLPGPQVVCFVLVPQLSLIRVASFA
jgi:hypothetical protein